MSLRHHVQRVVEAPRFQHTITAVIILNAATLGAATSPGLRDGYGEVLGHLDRVAVAIFAAELLAKLYVYRLRFFRDPWNCFDLLVVSIALVPAAGAFSVLRALRVLRLLRLISMVPSMRRVVATLLAAIPGVVSIIGLLALLVYVSAVMGTMLFGEQAPEYFGDLGTSLWTLFTVLTGESWPDIAGEVMDAHPTAWIFFLIYILISTFVVLNLFLAVVVSAMEHVRDEEEQLDQARRPDPPQPAEGAAVAAELAALRQEVAALRSLLEPAGRDGVESPPSIRR